MTLMRPILVVLLAVACGSVARADDTLYRLPLGDPARKGREVPVTVDVIVDTASGAALTADELAPRLAGIRLLLVGESHTAAEFHRVQLQILQALHAAGRHLRIGLEMYPYTEQASLDAWHDGAWSEQEFVDRSRWYEHWGYHWNYYRDIFRFARTAGIPLSAVNAPREVVSAVRKKGFRNLTPEEAAHIPTDIDTESADYRAFFKEEMNDGGTPHPGMTDDALKGMLAAQATWDATMAWNAVKALEAGNDPEAIMVVLVGAGHVAYGLGIERQARRYFDGPIASLIPVPVQDDDGNPIPAVRASYANYTWGVAGERESQYPTLGISLVPAAGGRRILDVQKDTVGARAGLKAGDLVTSIDGQAVTRMETWNRVIAGKNWGDVVTLGVTRAGEALTLRIPLRRAMPEGAQKTTQD
jgi:uncharacterized iron-regulated protein